MFNKAVRIYRHGGAEEMKWEDTPIDNPAVGEVRLRHTAIGVNFSDVNVRRGGFYPNHNPSFPLGLGNEAAGVVESVGEGVTDFQVVDRVAYAGMLRQFYMDTGAYSEFRNVPASRLVAIPEGVTDRQAAAILLKGCTASLIIEGVFTPAAGNTVLIHTAAAGVGSILCQWSKHLGATVIGTVGSVQKAEVAQRLGCDHVILYRETDFVEEVLRIAPNGIAAVFDGVGKDTFLPSLRCLQQFGIAVNYGNASGNVPPFDVMTLASKSLSICRVGVTGHIHETTSFRRVASKVFSLVAEGAIEINIHRTYALRDAAKAHAAVEVGGFTGSLILDPVGS